MIYGFHEIHLRIFRNSKSVDLCSHNVAGLARRTGCVRCAYRTTSGWGQAMPGRNLSVKYDGLHLRHSSLSEKDN